MTNDFDIDKLYREWYVETIGETSPTVQDAFRAGAVGALLAQADSLGGWVAESAAAEDMTVDEYIESCEGDREGDEVYYYWEISETLRGRAMQIGESEVG